MKGIFKSLGVISALALLSACSNQSQHWQPQWLSKDNIDQKSYAITYASTVQTYEDRVNSSYDIMSYARGVNDYFTNKNTLPVEQIRASLLNRMLDNDIYAYYSGVLDAYSFKSKMNYLSPNCWALIDVGSATQGIYDAMSDLQKNQTIINDDYIKQGTDQILHQCIGKVEEETLTPAKAKPTKKGRNHVNSAIKQ